MKLLESACRITVVTFVALVWIAIGLGVARTAFATGSDSGASSATTSSATASATGGGAGSGSSSNDSRSYAVGSGSPSANACQRIVLFGFSVDVKTCQLQQWAAILGTNPTTMQLQIACQDELLTALPFCAPYRKP